MRYFAHKECDWQPLNSSMRSDDEFILVGTLLKWKEFVFSRGIPG